MNDLKKNYSMLISWGLLILFFSLASMPFLEFGFSGDDIFNSQTKGMLITSQKTIFAFTTEIIRGWINVGRFYPLTFFTTYSLFYLIGDNLILYNFIHWFATILSLFFTCLFLYKLTKRKDVILLFLSLLPFCWSLAPNSPWVSQAFLLPLIISFIMLTLTHYVNFIELHKIKYLVYLSIFLVLSLLTYEIALVIPAVIILLNKWLKTHDSKQKLIATLTVFLITTLYLVVIIYLRHLYKNSYMGTSFGSISAFLPTFLKQLSGELPLMNVVYLYEQLQYVQLSTETYFIAFSY